MLYLIEPENYELYREDLDNMYRLRYKVLIEKKNWDVNGQDGMERDEYDEQNAYYLIYKDEAGIVRGCARLIEMIHPCLLDGCFRQFLPNVDELKRPGYWEAGRFVVDTQLDSNYRSHLQMAISRMIMLGLIEFSFKSKKVECYISLSYPIVKKLYNKYGVIIYDLSISHQNEDEMGPWIVTPMTYTFDKIASVLSEYVKYGIIMNLKNEPPHRERQGIN